MALPDNQAASQSGAGRHRRRRPRSAPAAAAGLPDYRHVFEATPTPYLLLTPDFTIAAVNDAYLRATATVREHIIGRNIFDVFPDNPNDPEANGVANLRASLMRVRQTKSTDTMAVQKYDIPIAGMPGGFEQRHWSPVNVPVLDAHGELTHIIHRVEDVTAVVQARAHTVRMEAELLAQAQHVREGQQFADLFQQAPTFMAMLSGPDHRVELLNQGFMRLTGHRDVVGRSVAECFGTTTGRAYVALLDEVYRSGRPLAASSALYAVQPVAGGDTEQRYIDFVFQPIRTPEGGVRGIFVEGVDVTDRVQANARRDALIRLTDALRDLRTPDEIAYAAARILGETLGASRVGYGAFEHATGLLRFERDWTASGVQSLAGTLDMGEFGNYVDDMKLGRTVIVDDVAADHRTAAAAEQLRAYAAAAFVNIALTEHGRLTSILFVHSATPRAWSAEDCALMREVAERARTATDRLASMLALRESEAKFRTIADAMPQMVWSTLPDGFHDYYNQQWYDYTGVPEGSTDGAAWNDAFHPDDQARAWQAWRHSLATGETYEIQYRLRHRSGEYRWVLGRALPIRDEGGRIVRWMGTCTDIHTQKLAEDALREAAQRKDEFLAMLAHELRNPLAPISTAAQLLRVRHADEKARTMASEIIVRQVRHMTALVDDLLDVSRVTRGLVELDMATLDLKQVINSAVEQALPLIEARRHALEVRTPPQRAHVRGDRTRLVQVIANVLNNAAKYTPPNGRIQLTLDVGDGHARVAVTDNGNGIAPALLPDIFDLFVQGERSPDRAQGGLGLGLALVRSLTALHGGNATADSAGEGQGSTFTITLPLAADGSACSDAAPQHVPGTAQHHLHVMIVDDNIDGALSLAELLRAQGHRVTVAEDAEMALYEPGLETVQAFILDIGLPGMDGYTLARHLRSRSVTAKALMIALTGYGQPADRVLSTAAGFDHHFVKPVDTQALAQVLEAFGGE
ncbi:hybrid sensor histidine kinase/response regulator [Pseudoduganella armeniaca]|uniref:histidine kinase n=1 Tax=Pseudoduganella armeniaca TaxID=2072590 RepID=A0A2R4C815_9BURK|nr:PAS domain-containing protein [Pseudoduganella armeniaca]AVR95725.1 hybrid sensor histidine kinase/response regulator [Pseudoduganella armeniaca]